MSKKNAEYDFKWCPGCGDFAVKRAIEVAVRERMVRTELPVENNVVVAGIGCSGNIGPQALRNLDVCAIIMDNGVYGLTKGQSSPTTQTGEITPTTPYGKVEGVVNPLHHYLSLGVSHVASAFSSKPREMAKLISDAMDYPGFAIVHVQSPCTTYFDSYDTLRGNAKKGIEPGVFDVPEDHDASDRQAALSLVTSGKIPLGLVFQADEPVTLGQRLGMAYAKAKPKGIEDQISAFNV